jgi:Ca2+/H+ antiporter
LDRAWRVGCLAEFRPHANSALEIAIAVARIRAVVPTAGEPLVPLAAPLSHATESVAAKTGDAVGGLLNATLGNLTE